MFGVGGVGLVDHGFADHEELIFFNAFDGVVDIAIPFEAAADAATEILRDRHIAVLV